MKARLLLSMVLALSPCLGSAQDALTVTDGNSSLKVTRDPPTFNYSPLSDPVRLPRTLEWVVDGRLILVYPSGPWGFIDVEHFHTDAHVGVQQIHAQGPMLGYARVQWMAASPEVPFTPSGEARSEASHHASSRRWTSTTRPTPIFRFQRV